MKTARIEKSRELEKMEKRYNEEVDEMETLLFDLQKKMSSGEQSIPEGQYWKFLHKEDYDNIGDKSLKINFIGLRILVNLLLVQHTLYF